MAPDSVANDFVEDVERFGLDEDVNADGAVNSIAFDVGLYHEEKVCHPKPLDPAVRPRGEGSGQAYGGQFVVGD